MTRGKGGKPKRCEEKRNEHVVDSQKTKKKSTRRVFTGWFTPNPTKRGSAPRIPPQAWSAYSLCLTAPKVAPKVFTAADLAVFSPVEQTELLLAASRASAPAHKVLSDAIAVKNAAKAKKEVNFNFEVRIHREGIEEWYGMMKHDHDGGYGSDEDEDEMDDLDRMFDVVMPAAWDDITRTFRKMRNSLVPESSYRSKKNALEAGVAIAAIIFRSESGGFLPSFWGGRASAKPVPWVDLAVQLRDDASLYEIIFQKWMPRLAEVLTKEDVSRLKKEGFRAELAELEKLAPDEGDVDTAFLKLFD